MRLRSQSLLGGLLGFVLSLPVAFHSLPVIVSQFMVDDSFYYLEIARNLAAGVGFTFDGLHQTNGFQPLFQLLLVPIYSLPLDLVGAVRAVKVLEAGVFGLVSALLFLLGARLTGTARGGWLSLLILFVPGPLLHPLGKGLFTGMESGVNALMLLLTLHMWIRSASRPQSMWFYGAYGMIVGLLFLARLDNAFLISGIAVWHVYHLKSSGRAFPRGLLLSALVALLLGGAYLAWNIVEFDNILPISGQVKSWLSMLQAQEVLAEGGRRWLSDTFWFVMYGKPTGLLVLGGLLEVPILLVADSSLKRRSHQLIDSSWRSFLVILWLTSSAKIAYYILFEGHGFSAVIWYYVQEILVLGVCVGLVGEALFARLPLGSSQPILRLGYAVLFGASLVGIMLSRPIQDWELASLRIVPQIESLTQTPEIIGSWDAGVLGYFLVNPVVNLGGLVNDQELFEHLREGRQAEYLRDNNIRYVASLTLPDQPLPIKNAWIADDFVLLYRMDTPIPESAGSTYDLYRVPERQARGASRPIGYTDRAP